MISLVEKHITIVDDEILEEEEGDENRVTANIGDWRNVIFLPFNVGWECMLIASVLCNCLLVMYEVTYPPDSTISTTIFFYICELFFFVDTSLFILHRNLKKHAVLKEFAPRNLFALFIDVLTLMPIFEIIDLVLRASYGDIHVIYKKNEIKMKVVGRLYRVYLFFWKLKTTAGLNQILIVISLHLVTYLVIVQSVAAVWYDIRCWMCPYSTWIINLVNHRIDFYSPIEWWTICFCKITTVFAHKSSGLLRGETIWEKVILCTVVLAGFVFHYMIFNAQLTASFVKTFKKQSIFTNKLKAINTLMEDWDVPTELHENLTAYYDMMWNKQSGCNGMPDIFYKVPESLRKEVTTDLYWELFRHTHLLATIDLPFKRALSSVVKSEFFMAQDYIWKVGERKNKLYFIISGIVQILSDEDDESPIVSFSSGSVLGEMSAFLISKSLVNVRCATYCEMHTLSMDDIYRIFFYGFRNRIRPILRRVAHRVDFAREMKERKMELRSFELQYTPIKWFKNRWRTVKALQKSSTKTIAATARRESNAFCCSDFLDLYVLSEDVELKMKAVCLTSKCPFVMDPDSSVIRAWQHLNLLSLAVLGFLVPFCATFLRGIPFNLCYIYIPLEIIVISDVFVQLSTAIKTSSRIISQPSEIILARCKEITFLVDVISSFPLGMISLFFGTHSRTVALLSLNVCFKTYKFLEYASEKERRLHGITIKALVVKTALIYLFLTYWITCLVYGLACYNEECYLNGFYIMNRRQQGFLQDETLFTMIIKFYYYVLCHIISGSYVRFQFTIQDLVIATLITVWGYFLFSYNFAEVCAVVVHQHEAVSRQIENIQQFRELFVRVPEIDTVDRYWIVDYLEFSWDYNRYTTIQDIRAVFADYSESHKQAILHTRIINGLKIIPLFKGCDKNFLNCVAVLCKIVIMPPQATFISYKEKALTLFFILRGHVKLRGILPGDRERRSVWYLTKGHSFSVIECLHNIPSFVEVTAVTAVETLCVNGDKFRDLLKAFPSVKAEIEMMLAKHLEKNHGTLMSLGGRLPPMWGEEPSLGPGDMFTYEIYDYENIDSYEAHFMKPFEDLGRWSFVRFLLLRHTINPTSKWYIIWESIRCVCSIVRVCVIMAGVLVPGNVYLLSSFFTTLDILTFPDVYIRLHCRYYNEKGLIVSHPLYTAKYYLRTSFPIDFLTSFPLQLMNISPILGSVSQPLAVVAIVLVRPVGFYRIVGLINYIVTKISNVRYRSIVHSSKYIIIILLLLLLVSTFLSHLTCHDAGESLECDSGSWVTLSNFKHNLFRSHVYLYSFYITIMNLASPGANVFVPHQPKEILWYIILLFFGFIMRWYIFNLMTSNGIVGNTQLVNHRANVKAFRNFMDKEYISEDVAQDVVDHFEHVWKNTGGQSIHTLFQRLYQRQHKIIAYKIYKKTLANVKFLSGINRTIHRTIAFRIEHQFYRKDAEIIRCNDVQKFVYIVHKGAVRITIAKTCVAELRNGAVFGNFTQTTLKRQTITATAIVHTELLVLPSVKLYEALRLESLFIKRLEQMNLARMEYCDALEVKKSDVKRGRKKYKRPRWLNDSNFVISHNNIWYKAISYILCIHLAPISCIVILHLCIINDKNPQDDIWKYIFFYAMDLIYSIFILIDFHVDYIDEESGILVRDVKLIYKRYLRNYSFVYFAALIPTELIGQHFIQDRIVLGYSSLNRVLRMCYPYYYYKAEQQILSDRTHLKWSYLFYWFFFLLQLLTCMWWLSACLEQPCKQRKRSGHRDDFMFEFADSFIMSNVLAYSYVISVFTSTAGRGSEPMTVNQLIVTMIIAIMSICVMGVLMSSFASILVMENYKMTRYEYRIDTLKGYLRSQGLSPIIHKTVWDYLLLLWSREKGDWSPVLYRECPYYIQQDIMLGLYGKYLETHHIFGSTHVDFIRQLSTHLQRMIFFPNYSIVEKGDMDRTFYIVHKGIVERYETRKKIKRLHSVLTSGMSFGESAGLYVKPHRHSYKALTNVEVITLHRDTWFHLLDFFPASRIIIHEKGEIEGMNKSSLAAIESSVVFN